MKRILNNELYDTENATQLFDESVYKCGNYAGDDRVYVTNSGKFFIVETSNGQDLYRRDCMVSATKSDVLDFLECKEISDAELVAMDPYGLIRNA